MCLITFCLGQNPHFPLVVAANRDEFFHRPTDPMAWWTSDSGLRILAGRDRQAGGTWLAITPDGEVSAVTNVREGTPEAGRSTRGELPLRALEEQRSELFRSLASDPDRYAGFNLIQLNQQSGWYFSNRDAHPGRHLHRGTYGLSNHLLQTPWPKLLRLRQAVDRIVETADEDADALHQQLIARLQDSEPAPDRFLPDTGVGLATERFLSSPFIVGDDYGTRATTVVTVSRSGNIRVTEQNWGPGAAKAGCQRFDWQR
ncbi:hypothetical protein MSNKSG1_00226 [Marinobacter santoriniensis NKSG1]|uniref:NRDE family protein n=1 Tax=Marinobacter santoriniensis NKSG1 TaxID=1288826 RepID=M7D9Y6_9GAMM|nr:NRDE family protein [Marinobacter santoriniensis]EMP57528.1 hypothetical protein MSNKSG1_00226 [Marinobacter santoriniensis NKSG1]